MEYIRLRDIEIPSNLQCWQFGSAIVSSNCKKIESWINKVSNNRQPRWQSPIRICSTCLHKSNGKQKLENITTKTVTWDVSQDRMQASQSNEEFIYHRSSQFIIKSLNIDFQIESNNLPCKRHRKRSSIATSTAKK